MDVTPFLQKILSQALKFGPNKHKQGTVGKVDRITASENVSRTNCISGAPYRVKMTRKKKQDVRKQIQHFKTLATLYDNELLEDTFGFSTKYNTKLTAVTETEQMLNHVKGVSNIEQFSKKNDGMKMLRVIENMHKRWVCSSFLVSVSFTVFS